jgi:hypothetical protein
LQHIRVSFRHSAVPSAQCIIGLSLVPHVHPAPLKTPQFILNSNSQLKEQDAISVGKLRYSVYNA